MDDDGKPSGIMMMVSDITDRKALERKVDNYSKHLKSMVELRTAQLKDANERLVRSERLAAIGELAGMIGHDLRNPLTGIKNAAYYLKKKGATCPEDQAKEMLEIIDKAIEHSNKIINDLLDYSREIRLELTEIETSALLNEAMRMIQVPDRIQVVNHVLGETWLKVDADKMMRVFINLIKNAVDAMPEGGTLEITSRQTGGKVEIAFADTGKGIPEEILQKIFMPLFTTKAQGMGFGLAICKRIIDSHGGTITVETVVNKGTTFTITLPIKPKLEAADKEAWVNMPESLSLTVPKTLETR
jgi:signal transduction histidine kinase